MQKGTTKPAKRAAGGVQKQKKASRAVARSTPAARLAQLERENKKLRATIDDVWHVLYEVDESTEAPAVLEAVDTACDYIITDMPKDYFYEEVRGGVGAVVKTQTARAERRIVELSGMSEEEFKAADRDTVFRTLRKFYAEFYGIEATSDAGVTDEELRGIVAHDFTMNVVLAAPIPFDWKKEAKRHLDTFAAIYKQIPKGKRGPGADVQKALDMLKQGREWSEIYPEAIPNFEGIKTAKEKVDKRQELRGRVYSVLYARRRRGGKRTVNTSPK